MAITTEVFNADGTQKTFTVASTILSQSHCRVDYYYDGSDHEIASNIWDVLSGSIIFDTAPTDGYVVKITVSTDGEELETAPSDVSDVAANIDDVVIVADKITAITTLAGIDAAITSLYTDKTTLDSLYADKIILDSLYADKATLDSLFADKTTLDSLFADKVTLDSLYADKDTLDVIYSNLTEILQAATRARESQLRAWEAEAEKKTADSYATEPEDILVKLYTSDGDGTFSYLNSTEYSALHWSAKASIGTSADDVSYNATVSGLDATDVQAAIDEVDGNVDTTQQCCEANSEAIANLATAQCAIAGDGSSIAVTTTQQEIDINTTVPSTDIGILTIDDINNTLTYKHNASFNFYATMTFSSTVIAQRTVSVKVIDVSDDAVLQSFDVVLDIGNGQTETVAPTFLLTVGRNSIPEAPLTTRFEIVADGTGYSLDSFKVVIASSSSYDVSTDAIGINYDNTASGMDAENVQEAIDELKDDIENVDALPDQTGNAGKYLGTDGNDASWNELGTDANSTTKAMYEHSNTISEDYTIATGNNAMSAGTITIADGVTVTIPDDSTWVIV